MIFFLSVSVQPRTHGEHAIIQILLSLFIGSTPYTRGTWLCFFVVQFPSRFNPVHTGNMLDEANVGLTLPVQPRTHGEHFNYSSLKFNQIGSTPYTRGTCYLNHIVSVSKRFNPVHTGNILLESQAAR